MQLPEGAWSIHSPKSGDTAFYRSDNTRRDIHIGRLGESDQLTDTRPLGERTFRNLAWRPGPERQLAWVDTGEPAIVVARPGGTTDLRIPLQSARRAAGFRWVNADLVFVSERSEDTRQPWHGLVLDLEGRAVNQMRATTADSLEIQVPKALDHRRWIAWSYDRDCIVEVAEKQLTRELKCFETDRYLSFSFVPSPWDERVLVRGFRPDSTAVQAVLDVETTEYRELIEDPTWVGTAWTSFDWVAPGFVTHGVDGWKQLLLINVETGERRPILSDLMREIEPNTLSIDLEQGWVALTGEGKKWTSPDRNTLTIVHGILDGEQAGGGR